MVVTEIKTEFVLATLGKGTKVTMCDFATNRMADCGEMTVNAINSFIEKGTAKFYSVVDNG